MKYPHHTIDVSLRRTVHDQNLSSVQPEKVALGVRPLRNPARYDTAVHGDPPILEYSASPLPHV